MPPKVLYFVETPIENIFTPSLDIAIKWARDFETVVFRYQLSNFTEFKNQKKNKRRNKR